VASIQPVTWLALACAPSSCVCRDSAALNSSSASWLRPRAAISIPVVWCSSSLIAGIFAGGAIICGALLRNGPLIRTGAPAQAASGVRPAQAEAGPTRPA
jgi:hypothetical protein